MSGYDYGTVKLTWAGVTYLTSGNFYWIYHWAGSGNAYPSRPMESRFTQRHRGAAGQRYSFYITAESLAGEGAQSATVSTIAP